MIAFAKRNMKIFFRDRMSVFFALLGALLIIGLFALFLGDLMVKSMTGIPQASVIISSWIVAGILAVTSVTATLGAFGTMITDKDKKIEKDFYVAPMNRRDIAGGYVLGSFLVGLILTAITLVIGEIYIVSRGGELLDALTLGKVIGVIILCAFSNTAMLLFLISFLKSEGAFAGASTIVGTMIGFLTGIYVNIGSLPEAMQMVVKVFPPSHGVLLLRQLLGEGPIDKGFAGAPAPAVEGFKEAMGISFSFGDKVVEPWMSIGVLVFSGVLFFLLAMWRLSRKKA